MQVGVFLARFQPIHNSHLDIIKKMAEENDEVHVFIGSAEKFGTDRNPFDFYIREKLVNGAIQELHHTIRLKISIHPLSDWTSEDDFLAVKEWGRYLYYNIVNKTHSHSFRLYYTDDIDLIENWFEKEIRERIDIVHLNRCEIRNGLSATMVRNAFANNDREFIKDNCPKIVYNEYYRLRVREMELRKLVK